MKISNREEFEKVNVFGIGMDNINFAHYFSGVSYLNPLNEYGKCSAFLANVAFEPGGRNNRNIYHATSGGWQLLICVAGEGWYQVEGKESVSLIPGATITIPTNMKHWYGAKKDSLFSHIAVEVPGENVNTEWCEAVDDRTYEKLQ